MAVQIIKPAPGELVGLSVRTDHILVDDNHPASSTLFLSVGTLPNGCASIGLHLEDSDFGKAMKNAVVEAVVTTNRRFGVVP